MTDGPQGDGWWQASDLKWYPPELHPDDEASPSPPSQPSGESPGPGWWQASDLKWYPPELHPDDEAPQHRLERFPVHAEAAAPIAHSNPSVGRSTPRAPVPASWSEQPPDLNIAASESQGPLPKAAYTSWIRRVGAAIIDAIPFMLLWILPFVYQAVHGVTCRANGFAACGPPLDYILRPPIQMLMLLLALGSKLVLLLVLGSGLMLGVAFDHTVLLVYGTGLVLLLLYAIWNWGYRQGTTGSTIGKSLLKFTMVSAKTGHPIGFGRSIVRELAHVVDWIIFYVGYLFPLWDAKRRTLADMIMATVCLATPTPQPGADDGRRKLTVGVVGAAIVVLAAAGIIGYLSPPASPALRVPFTGLDDANGVAVDGTGNLYVADSGNNRVLKLPAGSSSQEVLPLTGLNFPSSVAVDGAGNVFVTDFRNNRVLELAAGSTTQAVLPFASLNGPDGVAVDGAGDLYVADSGNNLVLELAAGSSTQAVLPFAGLNGPDGVAVDSAGNLYVTDTNRVLKLAAGSSTPSVLPFTGLREPQSVAVDTAGNVYVTDWGSDNVLKLAAGSTTPTVLPFNGLIFPEEVAVDTAGNLYVAFLNNPSLVVKLPAGRLS